MKILVAIDFSAVTEHIMDVVERIPGPVLVVPSRVPE